MINKIFTSILFLFLSSCGYEVMHSKKNSSNYNFSISKITFIGDRDVNIKIKEKINNYTLDKKNRSFILKISSDTEKVILAKDLAGNPTSFKSSIIVDIEVLMENNSKNNLRVIESYNYNTDSNKFELKKHERQILNNLAESATEKIISKLSNVQ